jgi:hypothetical protein
MQPYKVCALREAFEEAGVLITAPPPRIPAAEIDAARKKVHASPRYMQSFLTEHNLSLAVSGLHWHANWLTPANIPRRYNAHFFVTTLSNPCNFLPSSDLVETVGVNLYTPREAIEAALAHEITLYPPQFYIMCDMFRLKNYQDYKPPANVVQYCPVPKDGRRFLILPGDDENVRNRMSAETATKSGFVIRGAERRGIPGLHDFSVGSISHKL